MTAGTGGPEAGRQCCPPGTSRDEPCDRRRSPRGLPPLTSCAAVALGDPEAQPLGVSCRRRGVGRGGPPGVAGRSPLPPREGPGCGLVGCCHQLLPPTQLALPRHPTPLMKSWGRHHLQTRNRSGSGLSPARQASQAGSVSLLLPRCRRMPRLETRVPVSRDAVALRSEPLPQMPFSPKRGGHAPGPSDSRPKGKCWVEVQVPDAEWHARSPASLGLTARPSSSP